MRTQLARIEMSAREASENASGAKSKSERALEAIQTELDALRKEIARLSAPVLRIAETEESQDRTLGDLRILLENVARTHKTLAADCIERHAQDFLFKELCRIYGSLLRLAGMDPLELQEEIDAVCDGIERFLDSHGLAIIQPKKGAKYDPAKHQAIEQRPTHSKRSEGRIAYTQHPGLSRENRVVESARVAVYRFPPPRPTTSKAKEGTTHAATLEQPDRGN